MNGDLHSALEADAAEVLEDFGVEVSYHLGGGAAPAETAVVTLYLSTKRDEVEGPGMGDQFTRPSRSRIDRRFVCQVRASGKAATDAGSGVGSDGGILHLTGSDTFSGVPARLVGRAGADRVLQPVGEIERPSDGPYWIFEVAP